MTGKVADGGVADEVRTKRLVLVDDAGVERAVLGTGNGTAMLVMTDGEDKLGEGLPAIALQAGVERSLVVADRNGVGRLIVGVDASGTPLIQILAADGSTAGGMTIGTQGPEVTVISPGGEHSASLMGMPTAASAVARTSGGELAALASGPGGPSAYVVDKDSSVQIHSEAPGGGTVIDIYAGGDRPRLRLHVTKEGLPTVSFHDVTGAPKAFMGLDFLGKPSIGLFNEKGEIAKSVDTSTWW